MRRPRGGATARRILVVLAMTATGSAIVPMEGAGATILCNDKNPTIVGTARRDVLVGTPGRDIIAGKGGSDAVIGRAGDDVICGGAGADQLDGQAGRDIVFGDAGNDACYAHERAEGDLVRGCEKHRAPPPPPNSAPPSEASIEGAGVVQHGPLAPGQPAGFFDATTTCFPSRGEIVSTIHVSQASTDPAYVAVRPWFSNFSSTGVWEKGVGGEWEVFQIIDRSGSFDLNTYDTPPLRTFWTAHEWFWWDGSRWTNRRVTGWYKSGYASTGGGFVNNISFCAT